MPRLIQDPRLGIGLLKYFGLQGQLHSQLLDDFMPVLDVLHPPPDLAYDSGKDHWITGFVGAAGAAGNYSKTRIGNTINSGHLVVVMGWSIQSACEITFGFGGGGGTVQLVQPTDSKVPAGSLATFCTYTNVDAVAPGSANFYGAQFFNQFMQQGPPIILQPGNWVDFKQQAAAQNMTFAAWGYERIQAAPSSL